MFKKVIAIILLVCLCGNAFAALDMSQAQPYGENEFPKWTKDIRRSEIILFGSMPITYPVTSLVLSLAKKDLGFWKTMGIAASLSASIALTDFIIGLIKNGK